MLNANYMSNAEATRILLIIRLIKKIFFYKMGYFPEPYTHSKNKIEVKLDFPNYAKRSDLKSAKGLDTSKFSNYTDLAHLKSDVDKSDIDKLKNVPSGLSSLDIKIDKFDIPQLETTPVNLSKLSDVVKHIVKETEYDELIKKVNAIQTNDSNNLVDKADFNTQFGEIERKILNHNHDKYINTKEINKLMAENYAARLEQTN